MGMSVSSVLNAHSSLFFICSLRSSMSTSSCVSCPNEICDGHSRLILSSSSSWVRFMAPFSSHWWRTAFMRRNFFKICNSASSAMILCRLQRHNYMIIQIHDGSTREQRKISKSHAANQNCLLPKYQLMSLHVKSNMEVNKPMNCFPKRLATQCPSSHCRAVKCVASLVRSALVACG